MQKEIKPAKRLDEINEYYFSSKLREVALLNARGKDIISLAIGSPDFMPRTEVVETLCKEARQKTAHGYQPNIGRKELRSAFAAWYKEWYDVELDPDREILPLIGSKEGVMHVSMTFLNPGDAVLLPNPVTRHTEQFVNCCRPKSSNMNSMNKKAGNPILKLWKRWT